MSVLVSPAKLVLLAVHLAVNGDVGSLTTLAAHHSAVLRKDLLLRILLTYLPETLPSAHYVDFLQQLEHGNFPDTAGQEVDCSAVEGFGEDEAARKLKKLRLVPLTPVETAGETAEDSLSLFLLRRSYKVDEEAGLLDELPALLLPFLDHSPCIRTLLVSSILPLLRRNCEYYPQEPIPYTLQAFQQLPDRVAVNLLLSQTGVREADLPFVGRDLRGLIGPWLLDERRWKRHKHTADSLGDSSSNVGDEPLCPGWDEVLRWLTTQASKNWKVAVGAVEQWDGPANADLGGWASAELNDQPREHLAQGYARAALASAYILPDTSLEALEGAYSIIARAAKLSHLEPVAPLASALSTLPPLTEQIPDEIISARNATCMRNDLLAHSNILTAPTDASSAFLQALILSSHILTQAGSACTIRRAGELALLRDEREQRAEAIKLIHSLNSNGPKTDDKFWVKARDDILWLRDWGAEASWSSDGALRGPFSGVKRDFLEVEILKALLSNTRYSLARSIYEDAPDQPLNTPLLQDTVYATAMTAYDNATNPNRTRGGLKKCDDIIKAFPKTMPRSDPRAKRVEALLQATHSLGDYRLVLKQGEPFTPVVLRVHSDPISIIAKILEQNPKSYTQLHDFVHLGGLVVDAGLTSHSKHHSPTEQQTTQRAVAQHRITAMCINAALTEDDFETAYSYVVNRLAPSPAPATTQNTPPPADDYSWRAALQAGKYRRTAHTLPPTHLGTASANADVRHLEQRIECLATALRIAPPATLHEIVNAFRRAEEELEAALREEAQREDEWDARGDAIRGSTTTSITGGAGTHMPGAFTTTGGPTSKTPSHHHHHHHHHSRQRETDEDAAPMSLFDLSRASVLSAQRNLSALSSLQRSASAGLGRLGGIGGGGRGAMSHDEGGRSSLDQPPLSIAGSTISAGSGGDGEDTKRVRKRDQLREAAMGTLVSGVGWLVGAPAPTTQPRE